MAKKRKQSDKVPDTFENIREDTRKIIDLDSKQKEHLSKFYSQILGITSLLSKRIALPPSMLEGLASDIKKAYVSKDAVLIIKTEDGEITKNLIECEPELCMSVLDFITPKIKAQQKKKELERKKLEEEKRELERKKRLEEEKRELERKKKSRKIILSSDEKRERPIVQKRPIVQRPVIAPSSRKSIPATVILSLLVPGSGQVYLGKIRKGYQIFTLFSILAFVAFLLFSFVNDFALKDAASGALGPLSDAIFGMSLVIGSSGAIVVVAFWVILIRDAYRICKKINRSFDKFHN